MDIRERIERQADREEASAEKLYNDGTITLEQYRKEIREINRDAREAYAEAREEALEDVRREWDY